MDVLAFCIVLLALAAFVAAPLYRPRPELPVAGDATSARRAALTHALDELDVDRTSGLVDEPTYALERADLEAENRALDAPTAERND